MAKLARYVVPGIPHHVTQRGNGRQRTFFFEADYAPYRDLGVMVTLRQIALIRLMRDAFVVFLQPRKGV